MRCIQFNEHTELFNESHEPETGFQELEEQTFTRQEAKLYAKTVGQRTKTKRRITKRKTSTLGEESKTSRKANR